MNGQQQETQQQETQQQEMQQHVTLTQQQPHAPADGRPLVVTATI